MTTATISVGYTVPSSKALQPGETGGGIVGDGDSALKLGWVAPGVGAGVSLGGGVVPRDGCVGGGVSVGEGSGQSTVGGELAVAEYLVAEFKLLGADIGVTSGEVTTWFRLTILLLDRV